MSATVEERLESLERLCQSLIESNIRLAGRLDEAERSRGYQQCRYCHGQGYVTCAPSMNQGSATKPCPACNGQRTVRI